MIKENYYYVYLHRFSNGTFYVGKGLKNRAFKGKRNRLWKELESLYGNPIRGIYRENLESSESFELEQTLAILLKEAGFELCNIKVTGTGGTPHSEETKKQISEKHKGKKLTTEHKNKVSLSLTGIKQSFETKLKRSNSLKGNKNGLGYKHTESALKKIGETAKIVKSKRVVQKDLDNNIIAEFYSAAEAFRQTNISNIPIVCRGIRNVAGGYKWEYVN